MIEIQTEAVTAYLGLGSNLKNPQQQLEEAVTALEETPGVSVQSVSRWFQSEPVGPPGQPDYINGAVTIQTTLTPDQLLDYTQAIENQQGRVRDIRWGPRTLDIDILLFDKTTLETPRLSIPHPRIAERNFVLYPLRDVCKDLIFPNGDTLDEVIYRLEQQPQGRITPLSDKALGLLTQ